MKTELNTKTNFTGCKIIYKNKINLENKRYLNTFLEYKKDGKTNLQIFKNKSFDIFVEQESDDKLLTLSTKFKKVFIDKPVDYFITTLHPKNDKLDLNFETNLFRSGVELFKAYKKEHNGYNGIIERIVATFKEYI